MSPWILLALICAKEPAPDERACHQVLQRIEIVMPDMMSCAVWAQQAAAENVLLHADAPGEWLKLECRQKPPPSR